MIDDLDIPAFLRIPQEVRKAAWERNPPKAAQSFSGRELTETEKAYRASKEYDKALRRERDRPRFEAMRAKAAAAKAELAAVKQAADKSTRLRRSKFTSRVRPK